ncbi:MAG: trypsin-like peptidase domain-containing protein [Nakamurella sp.]
MSDGPNTPEQHNDPYSDVPSHPQDAAADAPRPVTAPQPPAAAQPPYDQAPVDVQPPYDQAPVDVQPPYDQAPPASPWAPSWSPGATGSYPQGFAQSAAFGRSVPGQATSGLPPYGQAPYSQAQYSQNQLGQPMFGDVQVSDAAPPVERHTKGARATMVGVAIAALALAAGFGGGLIGGSLSSSSSASSSQSLPPRATGQTASDTTAAAAPLGSVQQVATKILPSVVSVVALTQDGEGEGSGVVLTSSGLILTNNHVIDAAKTLTVQFNDGTIANATVVGADPTDDLAVLRVAGVSGLSPAVLGTSATVSVGQQVVAIGSPLGLSATVTTGIISAMNRPVRTQQAQSEQAQGTVLNAIQTDAAINPGNSGGPLVDMSGHVIGINSAIAALSSGSNGQAGSIGVGFAIPIDQAFRVAQEIIDTGTASHAVLGANVADALDASRGITTGAKIAQVVADSGAAKAGLKAGDVVTKVDSVPIESADALVATIRSSTPGGAISLTYVRSGQPHTVSVTLGSSSSK